MEEKAIEDIEDSSIIDIYGQYNILKYILNSLRKNRKLFLSFSFAGIFLSIIYSVLSKSLWEGQFEIVMASKNITTSSSLPLDQLIDREASKKLRTELQIIKSPSVLMPVFEYVKQKKKDENKNFQSISYKDWFKKSFNIQLVKGTSVLSLSYKDQNKELILPVLERITKTYQEYSKRDSNNNISNAIDYLDSQILIYNDKSIASLKEAQKFAIKYDLTNLTDISKGDDEVRNSINIEAIRVDASNKIRDYDRQLEELERIGDDPTKIMYFGGNFSILNEQGLPRELDRIDKELSFLLTKYKPEDSNILRIKNMRKTLIDILKERAYGYLYARRQTEVARKNSSIRPQQVLIDYKRLVRKSLRDESTLQKLEADRQVLALVRAKDIEPWELITTPTLLDKPVSLSNKKVIALGSFSGIILGILACFIKEKQKGVVLSEYEIESILGLPILEAFSINNDLKRDESFNHVSSVNFMENTDDIISLIPIGEFFDNELNDFNNRILNEVTNKKIILSKNLSDTINLGTIILLIRSGFVTNNELAITRKRLKTMNKKIYGCFLISET